MPTTTFPPLARRLWLLGAVLGALVSAGTVVQTPAALAQVRAQAPADQGVTPGGGANSLEDAADRAGSTARNVGLSLLALALAVAAVILLFKRDFKEAAGVFAIGLLAVLLVTPAGLALLRDTVAWLTGER
jgi:hypothetical protein